ncbi:CHAD domain-containing protein [Microbulbifer sp. OS29]|uniref:CHAD domain-containing protein n=1 Tax=Microbulbifer okhotskensis TaxID=2926617 RepID=A0A9X2J4T6_9GAMM|nr:CHAD domain-containing protein [Microbulbifer okhotskensis]MCO1332895.1 CHAD domain-containing protein [Microbulbifer okhotskensis]
MNYQLKCDSPLSEQIKGIAQEKVLAATEYLRRDGNEIAVHGLRKRCKKVRALLRLVDTEMSDVFQYENSHYRALSQTLARSRDLTALRIALLDLAPPHYFHRLHNLLNELIQAEQNHAAVTAALRLLDEGQKRIPSWPLDHVSWKNTEAGYQRGYQKAVNAWRKVQKHKNANRLHLLRKRAKDHWYQSRLLRKRYPITIGSRCESLKQLGQALGDWRDLHLLARMVVIQQDRLQSEFSRVLEIIRHRQVLLLKKIEEFCKKLFSRQHFNF